MSRQKKQLLFNVECLYQVMSEYLRGRQHPRQQTGLSWRGPSTAGCSSRTRSPTLGGNISHLISTLCLSLSPQAAWLPPDISPSPPSPLRPNPPHLEPSSAPRPPYHQLPFPQCNGPFLSMEPFFYGAFSCSRPQSSLGNIKDEWTIQLFSAKLKTLAKIHT